ncbi:hypothetical protein Zmor_005024 [Zophobas morio]|uniref:Uncharacterized protein n=1 Tax=Zophobas morio TaxID=2755281 RepID=A0AA38IVB5_9CUCU|nr:hypothetical protein Zmor_005024 [Zophobas morio]
MCPRLIKNLHNLREVAVPEGNSGQFEKMEVVEVYLVHPLGFPIAEKRRLLSISPIKQSKYILVAAEEWRGWDLSSNFYQILIPGRGKTKWLRLAGAILHGREGKLCFVWWINRRCRLRVTE